MYDIEEQIQVLASVLHYVCILYTYSIESMPDNWSKILIMKFDKSTRCYYKDRRLAATFIAEISGLCNSYLN